MDHRYYHRKDVFALLLQYHRHDQENHEKEQVNMRILDNYI